MSVSRGTNAPPALDPDKILAALEGWGLRLELDRVERLLAHFDSPQESYATILVAGTNGKGSTASLLASMITAAGYRTGLFTSPHLEGIEERIRIDGVAVGRSELGELLQEILDRAEAADLEPPTYFEALTVAGCLRFSRSLVDLAVFEVGMGGRLDATNTCSPVLSLISEIGLDHVKPLGETLGQIAREKAGIFRPGVVAISAASEPQAQSALRTYAREIKADLLELPELVRRTTVEEGATSQRVRARTEIDEYHLKLKLLGAHQVRNLLLAVVAAERLAAMGWNELDRGAIEAGVRNCLWPGRLERVELPGGKIVWLDVAHNPQGAESLARFLEDRLEDYDLLIGILEDKDAQQVLAAVTPRATRITLTRPPSGRALDPTDLAGWLSGREVEIEPGPAQALAGALEGARPLVICGSLYLVGWVRAALRERFGVPLPATNLVAEASDIAIRE